jgi:hypothetical protein
MCVCVFWYIYMHASVFITSIPVSACVLVCVHAYYVSVNYAYISIY